MDWLIYTPEQASKALQTSRETILEQCRDGKIPAYREGVNWKIPVDSLREYLKERATSESAKRRAT